MPMKMRRPCAHRGCPNTAEKRYCKEHAHLERQRDKARGTAAQRGYGARWQRYRAQFLRLHPLCVRCEAKGELKPATDVDHIQAVSGPRDPLFWAPGNHQALCHGCHSAKTMTESVRPKRDPGGIKISGKHQP